MRHANVHTCLCITNRQLLQLFRNIWNATFSLYTPVLLSLLHTIAIEEESFMITNFFAIGYIEVTHLKNESGEYVIYHIDRFSQTKKKNVLG
jgi:hypothetical protein